MAKKEISARTILIILTIVGFLLRLKAALNMDALADDMLYASQSAGIIGAQILSTHSQPPLFMYLTDFAYMVFGYTTFASRFWPLIAGTLLIPLAFYMTNLLIKNEKAALASAFFVAFSTFLIRMTFTEQTLLVLFFVCFAFLCGLQYMKTNKHVWVYLFGLSFGLASLTKYSAPFFFIAFAIFLGYSYEQNFYGARNKFNLKKLGIVVGIIFLLSLPFLAFNFFIYRENGIVDVYFSRIINVEKAQQLYGGLAGQGESFFDRLLRPDSYSQYKLSFITDPILTLFALFGLYVIYKSKNKLAFSFLLITLIVAFILQSGGSGLQKHFAFILFLLAIPAGVGLIKLKDRIHNRRLAIGLFSLVTIGMLLSLGTTYGTPDNFLKESATSQLKSFLNEKVDEQDLIILDSRIYSARSFWLATPNSFILSSQFPEIYNLSAGIPKERLRPTNVFFVECAIDDCGWGWVANDQDLNRTSEQLASLFASNGLLLNSISAPAHTSQEFFKSADDVEVYKVYYLTLNLPPELIPESKKIQSFYFTPYLYSNMNNYLFNYSVSGLWKVINSFGLWIIYLAMLLTILAVVGTIWPLARNKS